MSWRAIHQFHQVLEIFTTHRREFQSHSTPGFCVPHNTSGPDRAFLAKKLKPERRSHSERFLRCDKQTSQAQIPDSRSVLEIFAAPIDPDPLACLGSRVVPSPRSNSMF